MNTYRSDAVVVGGGIAGLCAALELLDAGKSVALLDRDSAENFGGLAKESFGGIFVVGTPEQRRVGAIDSPQLALTDWHSYAEFGPQDIWPKRWAEAYVHRSLADVYQWLGRHGVRFFPVPHWIERGQVVPGNTLPRFHMVWGTGHELAMQLIRVLESHPNRSRLEIRFGHRVDALSFAGGALAGCRGQSEADGTPFEALAPCVIVAAGGINGSIERVRRHWHRDWRAPPEVILNGSHRFADGRMHDAVQAAGGNLTHLDRMWNYAAGVHHPRPRKPLHGLSLVPPRSALWLNWRGARMLPPLVSGFDTRELVTRICAEQRQYSWQVMNRRIALKELAVSGAEYNPSIRERRRVAFIRDLLLGNRWLVDGLLRDCEDFVVADSVAELAAKMNRLQGDDAVDAGLLEREIRAYDERIARGPALCNDEQQWRIAALRRYRGDRIRTLAAQRILDPKAGPLIAVREFIISRKSLGGIQTDLACRVLDRAGEPIPGLYAAGESAGFGGGGMHGLRALEGSFLGGCILSGRMAGRAVAGQPAP